MKILYRLGLIILITSSFALLVLTFSLFGVLVFPWYILKGDINLLVKIIDILMEFIDKITNKL